MTLISTCGINKDPEYVHDVRMTAEDSVSKSCRLRSSEGSGFITHWHIVMEPEKHEIENKPLDILIYFHPVMV